MVPGVPAQGGPACGLEGGGRRRDGRGRTEEGWKAGCDPGRVRLGLSPAGALGTLASGAGGGAAGPEAK